MSVQQLYWYIYKNGVQYGPYTHDQFTMNFKQGLIAASDLVWNQEFVNWIRADQVPGLFTAQYFQQAPISQTPVAQAPIAQAPNPQAPVLSQVPMVQTQTTQAPFTQSQVIQAPVQQPQTGQYPQWQAQTGVYPQQQWQVRPKRRRKVWIPIIAVLLITVSVYLFLSDPDDPSDGGTQGLSDNTFQTEALDKAALEKGITDVESAFESENIEEIAKFTHPQIRAEYEKMFEVHKDELHKIADLMSTRTPVFESNYYAEYEVTDTNGKKYYFKFEKVGDTWYLVSF